MRRKNIVLTIGHLAFVNSDNYKELTKKYGFIIKRPLFKLLQHVINNSSIVEDITDISPKPNKLVVSITSSLNPRWWKLSFEFYVDGTNVFNYRSYRWKKLSFFKEPGKFTFVTLST